MYIRRILSGGRVHFLLRESIWQEGHWGFRDLLNLGEDPADLIEFPGGNGFYFKPELEQTLEAAGVEWTTEDLESLFMPFLPPHIQRILEMFGSPESPRSKWTDTDPDRLRALQEKIHNFDKRRLHYLRCGRIDMGRLGGRALKLFNMLLGKGRDEIENLIDGMEWVLRPHEIRPYIFTALDLQSYFPHHLLKNQPAALDPEKVDGFFLEAICALNRDTEFFRGIPDHQQHQLHPFLVKYVIRYFDHDFDRHRFLDEMLRQSMGRRQYRPARLRSGPGVDEACRRLGLSRQEFDRMSAKELARCYHSLIMTAHPDKGGDHESFIDATEAYECLLLCKSS